MRRVFALLVAAAIINSGVPKGGIPGVDFVRLTFSVPTAVWAVVILAASSLYRSLRDREKRAEERLDDLRKYASD